MLTCSLNFWGAAPLSWLQYTTRDRTGSSCNSFPRAFQSHSMNTPQDLNKFTKFGFFFRDFIKVKNGIPHEAFTWFGCWYRMYDHLFFLSQFVSIECLTYNISDYQQLIQDEDSRWLSRPFWRPWDFQCLKNVLKGREPDTGPCLRLGFCEAHQLSP